MKKYLKLFKISLLNRINYRQEVFISLLVGLMVFAAQFFLWRMVFKRKDEVKGFIFEEMMVYYLFATVTAEVTYSRLGLRLNDMILEGQVSNLLIKPVKVKLFLFFQELGNVIFELGTRLIAYSILFIIAFGGMQINLMSLPIVFIILLFSLLISFNLFFMMGCIAFWTGNTNELHHMARRIIYFLSGGIIPLAFFPGFAQRLIAFLPFKYILDLPSKILREGMSTDLLAAILIQLAWIIVLWILSNLLFKVAVKRNQSVGI